MTYLLEPVTIIPQHLYVERAADRQLKQNIESMGRPGYVLVARQMGKTNLLINARRTLESPDLHFVYVDLSIKIGSLEEYFALLLNTAYAVHPKLFDNLPVQDFPRDNYSPAAYEKILRLLLQKYPGRIVFVLDEIDSLANYSFSDRVFSHIRSLYFSRNNFPDYTRVTFVLSGVAEPNELIKDKNVSPFNIGQKIFLTDFSRSEFELFLRKAQLFVDRSVADRIFEWCGGNPRITWDVCAEIERAASSCRIDVPAVDQIVMDIYLTTFDRAPVDHIRTLASSDRDIRAAIRALHERRHTDISDRIRNKLYLAGITSMVSGGVGEAVLSIKNRIIEAALSNKWLSDVDKQSRNLLQLARENYEEKRYEPAVVFFEEYLANHSIDGDSADAYRIGISYFSTHRYEKAIEWLKQYGNTTESAEVASDVSFTVGRSQLAIGNFGEAADAFRCVLDLGHRQFIALANGLLSSSLVQLGIEANSAEIRRLCEDALAVTEADSVKSDKRSNARVVALLNLASLEGLTSRERALELVRLADQEQLRSYRPTITLAKLRLLQDGPEKESLLDELVDCVMQSANAPSDQKPDGSINAIALPALSLLLLNGRRLDFDRLLAFLSESGEVQSHQLPTIFISLYEQASEASEANATVFLRESIDRFSNQASSADAVLTAMRLLLLKQSDAKVAKQYLEALAGVPSSGTELSDADHTALGRIIASALQDDDLDQLLQMESVTSQISIYAKAPSSAQIFYAYFEMNRLERLGRFQEAVEVARRVLRWSSTSDALLRFGLQGQTAIQRAAQAVIENYDVTPEIRNEFRKFGRNTKVIVRYADGRQIEAKFKQVERDLTLGSCRLVR